MRCAYLTMEDMSGFVSDADRSIPAMVAAGWEVEFVPWRRDTDWDRFDAVYICTPWDYWDDVALFVRQLERIDASRAVLVNDLALVRWNLDKHYLADLEGRGASIVPSLWQPTFDPAGITDAFGRWQSERLVVKPRFGGNAVDTFVLRAVDVTRRRDELAVRYGRRAVIVQPFIDSVSTEGEHSLFFFSGELSHAVLKIPARGDFRTQEEHGAEIRPVVAGDALRTAALRTIRLVRPRPVYARADYVRGPGDEWLLMELELIEPSLYFRMEGSAAVRFAAAFTEYVRSRRNGVDRAPD